VKNILLIFSAIVLSALISGACSTGPSEASVTEKTALKAETTAAKASEDNQTHSSDRISLADAKKEYDAGTALIVDARAESSYKQERIKDSINIPTEAVETRWKELPKDKKLIVYCS
jgi:3-mercaptopyruvate sulfurtransferase SseA